MSAMRRNARATGGASRLRRGTTSARRLDKKVMVLHYVNMNHASRTEAKRDAKTEAILGRAMTLLREGGLEAVTLQRLASDLGYVPAALYRYFGSKEGLVAALQRKAIAEVSEELAAAVREVGDGATKESALARILAAARAYLALPATRPEAYTLVAVLLGDPRMILSPDEAAKTAPLLLGVLGGMVSLFEAAAEREALSRGDAPRRTVELWAALHGALVLGKLRRFSDAAPDPVDVGMSLARALLREWGAARLPSHPGQRPAKKPSRANAAGR